MFEFYVDYPEDDIGNRKVPGQKTFPSVVAETKSKRKLCKELYREVFPSSSLGDILEETERKVRREISRKFREWPRCVNDSTVEHQLTSTENWTHDGLIVSLECPNCNKFVLG